MTYWFAGLGHWCHLRPCDLGDLTPQQMDDCMTFIENSTRSN